MSHKVGRNEPCPCGSGRKYKRCCLGADDERASAKPDAGKLESHVDLEILTAIKARCPEAYDTAMGWEDAYALPPDQFLPFWIPLITWESEAVEGLAARAVAPKVRARLSPPERRYVDAQLDSWTSIWRVLDVTPGEGCHLLDELTRIERVVRERTATQTLLPGTALLGRVVRDGAAWMLHGVYPRTLPADAVAHIVDDVRYHLDLGTGPVEPAHLRGDTALELANLVNEAIVSLEFERKPNLVDGEGNTFCFVDDEYTFDGRSRGKFMAALETADDAHRGEPDEEDYLSEEEAEFERWVLTRPREDGSDGILATLEVGRDRLEVEAFSLEAADEVCRVVEEEFGIRLQLVRRSSRDPLDSFK